MLSNSPVAKVEPLGRGRKTVHFERTPPLSSYLLAIAVGLAATGPAGAGTYLIDLTHPIPTFKATEADPTQPDLTKPWLDSKPIPSFGSQAVLSVSQFPTSDGHFDLGGLGLLFIVNHFNPGKQFLV